MANTKKYVSLDKLGLYDAKIKGVISDGDVAALKSAKDYADSLAVNYDAAGSAASALEAAKAYADGKDSAIQAAQKAGDDAAAAAAVADGKAVAAQGEVDALEAYVGTFTSDNAKSVVEYIDEKTTGIASDAVVNALSDRVTQAEKDIDAIEADYLKAADKTELEGKISTAQAAAEAAQDHSEGVASDLADAVEELEGAIELKADQTALDAVSGVANAAATKAEFDAAVEELEAEDERIAGLVADEIARATGVEAGLEGRLVEVETFFKTAEDETIDKAMDTLVEIQKYITEDGAAADQMVKDIAANKKAIEDHAATDHDFAAADATLKSELEGKINGKVAQGDFDAVEDRVEVAEGKIEVLEGEMDDAEGRLDAVEDAVSTKAEAQSLTDAVAALEGTDATLLGKIEALEGKFTGEGSVEDMIEEAKEAAIEAAANDATSKANQALVDAKKYADEEDAKIESRVDALETASSTHALASDLTALDGRVTKAEGEIDTLQSEMDAVEALAAANESAIKALQTASATHALQSDLEAVSGRVTTIETWHSNFVEVSEQEINDLFA